MKTYRKFIHIRVLLPVALLWAPMLLACAKSGVPVPIHGVNYSGQTFSYVVVDPINEKNAGGGETIGPFEAGGTMCCFTLPAQWRPGIKVEIRETYWLPKLPNKTLPEVNKKHLVEVAPYAKGEVGELWVVRAADGTMGLVSSNYQPNHPKWPGKIKGWPIPDLAYRRQRYDLYIKDAQETVDLYHEMLDELNKVPAKRATDAWEYTSATGSQELKNYSGPLDPAYLAMLRKDYLSSLLAAQVKLKHLEASRP